MKIKTNQFGEIEFNENLVIRFEDGILGFENYKEYLLLREDNGLFYWLTAVQEPEIVFPLFPIKSLVADYPDIDGYEPYSVVRLNRNPADITANLKAPVYLDSENKRGIQKIIDTDRYQIDYKLFIEN